jgi:hypothetical protein
VPEAAQPAIGPSGGDVADALLESFGRLDSARLALRASLLLLAISDSGLVVALGRRTPAGAGVGRLTSSVDITFADAIDFPLLVPTPIRRGAGGGCDPPRRWAVGLVLI